MPDELFMTISTITGLVSPSVIRTSSIAAAESEWIETEPRSKGMRERALREIECVRDAEDARLDRQRLAVCAVARDRLQRLRDDDGELGLVVDAVEQLAHLRLGEEEAPVLVVAPVDRHADVVQERREDDDDLGVVGAQAVVALQRGFHTVLHEQRRSLSAMFATIWTCTHEWSLIWSRTTAFTFETSHHALICESALTFSRTRRSFRSRAPGRGDASARSPRPA